MIEIELNPGDRKLRQFGGVAFVAFGLLGGWTLWRGGLFGISFGAGAEPTAIVLFVLGGLSGLFSLAKPRLNQGLYVVLIVVTFPIGWVLSHVILGILFYLVISPVGIVFRLVGRDKLNLKADPSEETMWIDRSGEKVETDRYFKQY